MNDAYGAVVIIQDKKKMHKMIQMPQEVIDGFEFDDKKRGSMLLKKWGPDGQWVSIRKATAQDLSVLGFIGWGL